MHVAAGAPGRCVNYVAAACCCENVAGRQPAQAVEAACSVQARARLGAKNLFHFDCEWARSPDVAACSSQAKNSFCATWPARPPLPSLPPLTVWLAEFGFLFIHVVRARRVWQQVAQAVITASMSLLLLHKLACAAHSPGNCSICSALSLPGCRLPLPALPTSHSLAQFSRPTFSMETQITNHIGSGH